jgi:hypothetical protein
MIPDGFLKAGSNKKLSHADLHIVLDELEAHADVFPSDNRFVLDINRVSYAMPGSFRRRNEASSVTPDDAYIVVPRVGRVTCGASETVEMYRKHREEEERHAANSAAWKERNAASGWGDDAASGGDVRALLATSNTSAKSVAALAR